MKFWIADFGFWIGVPANAQSNPKSKIKNQKFCWLLPIVLLFTCLPSLAKDLLVDASAHSMWVAASVAGEQGAAAESLIFVRPMSGDQWQQLYQIASPVAALTHQGNEPAILLDNGQWMFVYQNGRSLGNDIPGGGDLVQIAGDGAHICGAAWVPGGIKAIGASSRPTRAATTTSSRRLVLMRYVRGRWEPLAEIGSVPLDTEISLSGDNGNLLLAWRDGDDRLQVSQWSSKSLQHLPTVKAPFKIADFEVLYAADQPVLWLAPASGAGSICKWDHGWQPLIQLSAQTGLAKAQTRDICIDTDQRLRLIYAQGDRVFEQNYDVRGVAAGGPNEILNQQENQTETTSSRWLGIAFTAMVVFVLLSAFRRQQTVSSQTPEEHESPPIQLAPMGRRLAGGFVDLLPYLITVVVVSQRITTYSNVVDALNDSAIRNPILIAMGVYLLHTTIGELFFARSIGKFLFGLKITTLRGTRPSALAVIGRNLCRLIDLPVFFLTILISPLRQRIGDLAAGTVVVTAHGSAAEQSGKNEG